LIRQKPANLLFAFAETSTEPPRASWGRSTRSHNDCRVRSPAGERQPPGARSISACFHSHEHFFQASVAFRPPTLLPRRIRPWHGLSQLPVGRQAPAAPRSVAVSPHLGGPAGPPLTLRPTRPDVPKRLVSAEKKSSGAGVSQVACASCRQVRFRVRQDSDHGGWVPLRLRPPKTPWQPWMNGDGRFQHSLAAVAPPLVSRRHGLQWSSVQVMKG